METSSNAARPKREYSDISYAEQRVLDMTKSDGSGDEEMPAHKKSKLSGSEPANVKPARATGQKTSFMDLPGEIRNKIYNAAGFLDSVRDGWGCIQENVKDYRSVDLESCGNQRPSYLYSGHLEFRAYEHDKSAVKYRTAILRTCRQISEEAIGYFYDAKLLFRNQYVLWVFLLQIGARDRARLTHLSLPDWESIVGDDTWPDQDLDEVMLDGITYDVFTLLRDAAPKIQTLRLSLPDWPCNTELLTAEEEPTWFKQQAVICFNHTRPFLEALARARGIHIITSDTIIFDGLTFYETRNTVTSKQLAAERDERNLF